MVLRACLVLFALSLCAGCGASSQQLRRRAAVDLRCSASELTLHKIDPLTFQVSGCGNNGTYVSTCNYKHDPQACTWILNSRLAQDTDAAPYEAPEVPEQHRDDARIETDRAGDGSTRLKLYMSSYDWTLYFSATPRTDGRVATVVWRIPKTYPNQECEIKLVADGLRVELGAVTQRIDRARSYDYQTTMPYGSLLSLAESVRIAGRLCGIEATLTDLQISKIRELVVRIREEHAWDEEPARTSDEARVAPTEL